MPVLLNTHSHYSFLTGLPAPQELAEAAARAGQPAIALTDHQHLSGAIEFYDACLARGVQPILGLDLDLRLPRVGLLPLTLLAMDLAGWGQLCTLSSAMLNDPRGEAVPLSFDLLAAHQGSLLCLAPPQALAWRGQPQAHPLNRLKQLFGDRLYLRLPPANRRNNGVGEQANKLQVPLVAAWPVYYLRPEQAHLQRLQAAMRLNLTLGRLPAEAPAPLKSYFPSNAELQSAYSTHPRALELTEEIAARCKLQLPLGQPHFPKLDLPNGLQPIDALRQKAFEGARRLYGELNPQVTERLEHELSGIQASGYTSLFLIMEEIISFARQADVPTSSRGSAASSLVAHSLGITTPDPLRLNLYFERFLNPARHSPPDVDTDLCSRRRDIVIQHVYDHYGPERVAMVATINRFRRRSALREVAKAHGLEPEQIKRMVAELPYRYWGPPGALPSDSPAPYADLAKKYTSQRFQTVFQQAEALLNVPHHLSIHPGGVVITSGPLNELVPTQLSSKGVVITQFDLGGVERMGLVKIDLLGIRGLTVLGDVADQLRKRRPDMGATRLEVLESIPDIDPATAELVRTARTIGCFQIESPGMRATLKEVQSASIDDVMVALALFRPGPLTGGLKDAFVRRHLGQEPVSHLHPALEPLLAETHGVILYQEQVLRIAHELAGFSLAESDMLRRAMSHFDPGKRMQTLKEKFIAGAQQRSGLPPQISERVWELMAAFAGYGFPKAHAASYALTAWRSAWCKAHYPAEFMAAVLANWGGYYGQSAYLMEARRMGLKLHPPHINHSRAQFSVTYLDGEPRLYMGLDQLRDLTRDTQKRIMRLRPFDTLADFLTRAYPRKGEARNLIEAGALQGLGTIPTLLTELETGTWRRGQLPLFSTDVDPQDDWPDARKSAAQERLLGVSLVAHPLDTYAEQIAASGVLSTLEAAATLNRKVRVAGMRQTWRRTQTAAGNYLYFMDLGDFEGTIRVLIPEEVYLRDRPALAGKIPLLVEGRVELGRDSVEPMLNASRIQRLDKLNETGRSRRVAAPG